MCRLLKDPNGFFYSHNLGLAKVYFDIIYYFITTKTVATGGY